MLAIVCPGQGAQKPGFLAPWLELPGVGERLAQFSEHAGVDLTLHGTTSDADTIRDTAIAQPLLVSAGIVAGEQLRTTSTVDALPAQVMAGHSVGEVTVAALSGVVTSEEAMALVAVRANAMAEAAAAEDTAMAAVVGGERSEVLEAISRHGLSPANFNSATQVVAAGSAQGIAALAADAPTRARVIPLQVAGAFHTHYMSSARSRLEAFAPTLLTKDPSVPLISNAGGEAVTSGQRYLDLLVAQVSSPVDWASCSQTLASMGVTAVIELAPAGTLTGLAKRELKGVELLNLNTPDDLHAAQDLVREHGGNAVAHG